ncbi:restriction endonuclease subunit S [Bacteroides finegoldii]|uniref:Type I restriction endonuclease subunit S n=2 Tax=Bacteroides finegoldii TaxID=338188 RepID=A0A7J4YPP1_9BACE|nr:restriction endonuclease subunit S [Bacteroides finegoldii]KAA5221643.1 type I restriction endonuclease subunit S [Bacteroides finegoldii]KAA5230559.1 type I restriction endonuclease subunit S [Bacteroides finegoldii]KAA5249636.1 type I restriction endonuclease subunit S [Bacteroides finegoldii]
MNGKQLKNSILQWAIQGKLVPQDPNDEPASVLLEKIRTEKARLVKEGKIKKDKNESFIFRGDDNSYYEKFLATGEVKCIDEEIPFEIPQGWEWCRLSLLIYPPKYGTSKKSVPSGLLPVLRMGNIQDGEIVFDKLVYSNDLDDNKKLLLQYGDLLFNRTNSAELVGKTAIFRGQRNAIFAGYLILLRPIFINSEYLNLLLNTPYARDYCNEVKTIGVQQCNINAEKISNLLIPVPNLHETVAIVEKVKNIALPIIKYGEFYQKLKHLNRELPIIIRKSILQEAIQGKLVPQIAEEGTARELLEQIKTEKEKLVREGKLKKSALTDSVIFRGDDNKYYERINAQTVEIELPFEYPNNWSVLRLKDICQLIDGEKRNGKGICLDAKYLRGKSSATIVEKGKFVYAGDNIILVDGENSGEVFTVPQDGYMGSTFKQLWLSSAMWKPYILAFILFYKEDLRNSKRGAAIPHLNKELFYNLPIGIPPYQEQQRIAKRINELSQLLK